MERDILFLASQHKIPDVLDITFAAVVVNLSVEYLASVVSEQRMYGMCEVDIIYGLTLIIVHVNAQCHPSNSKYNGKSINKIIILQFRFIKFVGKIIYFFFVNIRL